MKASQCTHWLDIKGHTFDCYLPLVHGGKHVAYREESTWIDKLHPSDHGPRKSGSTHTWKVTGKPVPEHLCRQEDVA